MGFGRGNIVICFIYFFTPVVTNGLRHGDPFAAFIRDKVKQANIKQGYREQRRQGRVEIRGRAMGQGRRQTERITRKQAGSERQAANNQERELTVQVKHGKTN